MVEQITDPDRARLAKTFDLPLEEQASQWEGLWEDNFMPWDRGLPSPALVDLLSSIGTSEPPTNSNGTAPSSIREVIKQPQRSNIALVPGCGKGYDVKLLAEHGFNSYGVDIAERAIELARDWYAEHKLEKEGEGGKGKVGFTVGDFFKEDWVKNQILGGGGEVEGSVGLIYDYTFLCALHPELRLKWAKQMAHLLAKGTGLLICLEFPLYKGFDTLGPPWALRPYIYDELLQEKFELVERYKPARTHKIGEGSDMLSVWRRKA